MNETEQETQTIDPEELQRRVIYSLLMPAVRMAGVFGVPLKEMKDWIAISYFHELKQRGFTQNESASHLSVSRRTIIDLAKRLRDNFFAPERHGGVTRRIIFMLWAGPMTYGRLRQALGDTADGAAVDEALALLESEEQVVKRLDGNNAAVYEIKRAALRLYETNWIARIDGLNNQLDHIANIVFARFFGQDTKSFVRTIGLSVRREDSEEFERFYREVIFPELERLDRLSREDPESELMELSISWGPKDFLKSRLTEDED